MENRQRITLYDQMMTSSNTNNNTRSSLASLIQNDAVLALQKTPNQTLLDIIRQNEPNNNVVNNNTKDRKSWKAFKELLRLKRRNSNELTESTHQQQNETVHEDTENSDPTGILAGGEFSDEDVNVNNSETAQVSMSLMDLLEETEVDLDLSSDVDDDGGDDVDENRKEEEEKEEEREDGGNVTVEYSCCVCMVRNKGAAFIPCGHTFCRMCSREIWVSRGNCPLCNNLILEILDIF